MSRQSRLPTLEIAGRRIDIRFVVIGCTLLSLALYALGLRWPLLVFVIALYMIVLPMPKILGSWFSRCMAAILLVYAILQVAELMQFILLPSTLFGGLAFLFALISIIPVFVFGDFESRPPRPVISRIDLFVVVPCVLLILSLSPVLFGPNNLAKITAMAGVQITDSIAHYGAINGFFVVQHLKYSIGGSYYPVGFHDATAYIEYSLFGNVNNSDWVGHVVIYLSQYILLALQMLYVLVYLGYSLFRAISSDKRDDIVGYLVIAATAGMATILLHSLPFIYLGFLNFFYVCSSLLLGMIFLLDHDVIFRPNRSLRQNLISYTWPVTALLLLGFGASFSWTLFVPAVLLSAALAIWPVRWRDILSRPITFVLANIGIILAGLCNVAALYMQYHFSTNSTQLLAATGAIHSFNVPLLLVGLAATAFVVARGAPQLGRRLVATILPYVILVGLLLFGQLFVLGEARYYVIKAAIVLEMFSVAILTASVARWLRSASLPPLFRFLWGSAAVLFLLVGTISLQPQPLEEVRSLLRTQSHVGKPPFLDSDSAIIAHLGAANDITNFNVTILHYDSTGNKLFAQIEPALWANAMTKAYVDPDPVPVGSRIAQANCFGAQFSILAYGTGSSQEQQTLIADVRNCITIAVMQHEPYYIATDPGSVAMLRSLFGAQPIIVSQ